MNLTRTALTLALLASSTAGIAAEDNSQATTDSIDLRGQFNRLVDILTPDTLPFIGPQRRVGNHENTSFGLPLKNTGDVRHPRVKAGTCTESSLSRYQRTSRGLTPSSPSNLPHHRADSCTGMSYSIRF